MGTVRITFNRIEAITKDIEKAILDSITSTAETVANVSRGMCPVDTGAAQAGIYLLGAGFDTYDEQSNLAQSLAATKSKTITVEAKLDPPQGDATVYIGQSMYHGELIESGSPGGRVAARPYLVPALEGQRGGLESLIKDALRQL